MIAVRVFEQLQPGQRKPGECDSVVARAVVVDLEKSDVVERLLALAQREGNDDEILSKAISNVETNRAVDLNVLMRVYDEAEIQAASPEPLIKSTIDESLADGDQAFDTTTMLLIVDDTTAAPHALRPLLLPRGELPELRARLTKAVQDGSLPPSVLAALDCGRLTRSVIDELYGDEGKTFEFGEEEADRYGSGAGPASTGRTDNRRLGSGKGGAGTGEDEPDGGAGEHDQMTAEERARNRSVRGTEPLVSGGGGEPAVPANSSLLAAVHCPSCGETNPSVWWRAAASAYMTCRNCGKILTGAGEVPAEPATRRATRPTEKSHGSPFAGAAWDAIARLAGSAAEEPARRERRHGPVRKSAGPTPRQPVSYNLSAMTLEQAVAILEAGA